MLKKYLILFIALASATSVFAASPKQFYQQYKQAILTAKHMNELFKFWHKSSMITYNNTIQQLGQKGGSKAQSEKSILGLFKHTYKAVGDAEPKVTINGDKARILVKVSKKTKNETENISIDIKLIKQGNDWKVLLSP